MKKFIVITSDGYAYDNEGYEINNEQVLDYINSSSLQDAKKIAEFKLESGDYGNFEDFKVLEIKE